MSNDINASTNRLTESTQHNSTNNINNTEILPEEQIMTVDNGQTETKTFGLDLKDAEQVPQAPNALPTDSKVVMSPGLSSPIYGRYKYYSAQKTGFEHLAPDKNV